jgi:antitoxin (DNA-binding transcriptional repressor) of toxin-antitoxin stability system
MASKQHKVEWTLKVGTEGGAEITALQRNLKTLGQIDSFTKLKRQTGEAEAAWKTATDKVAELARAMKTAETPTKAMATALDRARTQAGRLKDEFIRQRSALNDQRKILREVGVNTTDLSRAQAELKRRVQEQKVAAEQATRAHKELGKAQQTTAIAIRDQSTNTQSATRNQQGLNAQLSEQSRLSSTVVTGIKNMIGAYLGFQTVRAILSSIYRIMIDTSTANFALEASTVAANREFSNTASVAQWKQAIRELSAELRIYSEAGLTNAAARTQDMTKRLGLSYGQMVEVLRRAGEMAAGRNLGIEESVERVTAALRGEAEAAEYLGLTLNETAVRAWHEAHNVHNIAYKDLTELEKAQIRYSLLLEQTDASLGRAAKNTGVLAGAWKELTAVYSDSASNDPIVGMYERAGTAMLNFLSAEERAWQTFWKGIDLSKQKLIDFSTFVKADSETREKMVLEAEARKTEAQDKTLSVEQQRVDSIKEMEGELSRLRTEKWDEWLAKTESSLEAALKKEEEYTEQLKALAKQRLDEQKTTDELVREVMRTSMSASELYFDKLSEARDTLSEASKAKAEGDSKQAMDLYNEARRQFSQLSREVKDGETTIVSAAQASSTAISGIKEAGQGIQEVLAFMQDGKQMDLSKAQGEVADLRDRIQEIKDAHDKIKELETELKAKDLATPVLEKIQREIAKIQDKTVTIKTIHVDEYPRRATGGRIPGYAFGGRLPGYSLKDNMLGMIRGRTPIALAGGEDVTNALSSRIIYRDAPWLLPSLNQVRSSIDLKAVLEKIKGLAGGGRIPRASVDLSGFPANMRGLAGGGRATESYRFTFASAGQEATITTKSRPEAEGLAALARAMTKHKLVHGG